MPSKIFQGLLIEKFAVLLCYFTGGHKWTHWYDEEYFCIWCGQDKSKWKKRDRFWTHNKGDAMKPASLRKTCTNVCANCVHLSWGTEQGWDLCGKHDFSIYWPDKKFQVCDDHEFSTAEDPRKARNE